MLTRHTLPILPAGIFEDDDDRLTVRFGVPFQLCVPLDTTREERDASSAEHVMVQIGRSLPERMWGIYRKEITNELDHQTVPLD